MSVIIFATTKEQVGCTSNDARHANANPPLHNSPPEQGSSNYTEREDVFKETTRNLNINMTALRAERPPTAERPGYALADRPAGWQISRV